jgi:hypothetical protein
MRRVFSFGAEISWEQKHENRGVQESKTGLSDLMQMRCDACKSESSQWLTTSFLFGLLYYDASVVDYVASNGKLEEER